MINLILYQNSAERNRLNKLNYLFNSINIQGILRSQTSIITPSLLIDARTLINVAESNGIDVIDSNNVEIIQKIIEKINVCNYCYIPNFNRYYFITDIISVNQDLWQLNMTCDVLMSYKDQILNLSGFISRNENEYNIFIEDDLMNFQYDKEIQYVNLDALALSTITKMSSQPNTSWNNAIIAYLTDNDIKYSGSAKQLDKLPPITSYASGSNMSTQYMTGPTGIIYDLAKNVYKVDTLLTYIKNIMVYPFDIPSVADSSVTTIKIGTTNYNLTDTFKYPLQYPGRLIIADFYMASAVLIDNSFRVYSPYSTYEFYIPYVGYIQLSYEAIADSRIKIFYVVNYEDGSAYAYIYNQTSNVILYSGQCNIGVKISLSSTNTLEINNQKTALALNAGINLIGSAVSFGMGVATGRVASIGMGISRATYTIGKTVSSWNQLYDQGKVGISSAVEGLSNIQNCHLKITRTKPVGYDTNYFHLHGRPLNAYKKLSDLSGMTVVNDIHLEGLTNAFENEKNQIDTILKSGIIL